MLWVSFLYANKPGRVFSSRSVYFEQAFLPIPIPDHSPQRGFPFGVLLQIMRVLDALQCSRISLQVYAEGPSLLDSSLWT